MLDHVTKLSGISRKPERLIIGLMSGTSLDGLDIALCLCRGSYLDTEVSLLKFETIPYPVSIRNEIRNVFAQKKVDLQYLCALHPKIGLLHAGYVNSCLTKWNLKSEDIDLIASHGQTVMHAPARLHRLTGMPDSTLQIGDGDHIASHTGIITVSDFRQKHIAHGGEGAPLAIYGDYLLFGSKEESRILLNIGGIANFSFLPAAGEWEDCIVTDTGPGNTLIDAWVRLHFNQHYDKGGQIARRGKTHTRLLSLLMEHPFFQHPIPKSTGPEDFSTEYLFDAIHKTGGENIAKEDVLATLTLLTAQTIADTILLADPEKKAIIYLSGGGMHNDFLVELLKELLPEHPIATTEVLGIPGDAKEAVLFAVLANECVAGTSNPRASHNRFSPFVSMGKISFPD
jgi:anhydro-N-acetylmuramic acid kinase